MQKDILPITNPNYLHGCHPIDLSDSPFSLIVKQVRAPSQSIDPRLRIFKRIMALGSGRANMFKINIKFEF